LTSAIDAAARSAPTYVPAVARRPTRVSPFNRSFTWAALVTMLLYLFLCWPVGVIANLMWLSEAEGIYRKTGVSPAGRGCLKLLGLVFVLVPFVLIVFARSRGRPSPPGRPRPQPRAVMGQHPLPRASRRRRVKLSLVQRFY
jgi:hypothetical protein